MIEFKKLDLKDLLLPTAVVMVAGAIAARGGNDIGELLLVAGSLLFGVLYLTLIISFIKTANHKSREALQSKHDLIRFSGEEK